MAGTSTFRISAATLFGLCSIGVAVVLAKNIVDGAPWAFWMFLGALLGASIAATLMTMGALIPRWLLLLSRGVVVMCIASIIGLLLFIQSRF